jgi:hypothetical protein
MTYQPQSLRIPASPHAELLELVEGCFRIGMWRNVSIGVFAAQATRDIAERALRVSKHMHREHPAGHSSINFIVKGTPAPTEAADVVFAQVYDSRVSHLACLAMIVEGEGFWASRIRSRITGLRMAVGGLMVLHTDTSIEDVVSWFPAEHAKRTGTTLDPAELTRALVATRALGAGSR